MGAGAGGGGGGGRSSMDKRSGTGREEELRIPQLMFLAAPSTPATQASSFEIIKHGYALLYRQVCFTMLSFLCSSLP